MGKLFYNHFNKKDITDADYAHIKKVCEDFEKRNLVEYYEYHLYVQSNILFQGDVAENLQNNFIEIYELYPVSFLSVRVLT